jgi:hypothetical protein
MDMGMNMNLSMEIEMNTETDMDTEMDVDMNNISSRPLNSLSLLFSAEAAYLIFFK